MSASGGANFPGPVDVKDNQKDKKNNKDYCSVYLEVKGLKVGKFALVGNAKPTNGDVSVDFQRTSVEVKVEVTPNNGETTKYEYKKNLPEDIDPEKSRWKVEKDTIVLQLFKAEGGSWNEHAKHFIRPE